MIHLLSIYIIISLGFFQFMPKMHAEEGITEHTGCNQYHNTQHSTPQPIPGEHDMSVCLDALYIISVPSANQGIHTPIISIPSSLNWYNEYHPFYRYSYTLKKGEDPPFFQSHSLVGIVKLTI